ncbi:MAG TPA: hypothetical protein VHF24_12100 [Acidimicrobiales bacterium]|nr:hypothetical protein [Acidimicrobiales bacterium]
MGIWVVVLEAVAGQDRTTIRADDLDALADALAPNYPQVTGGPSFFQAQLWVEEGTAGAALMLAQRLWQSAVREVGLPPWDVVRGEARDAHAIEAGLIEWSPETDGDEFDEEPEEEPFEEEPAAALDEEELEEEPGVLALEEEELEEEPEEVLAGPLGPEEDEEEEEEEEEELEAVPTGGFDLGDEVEEERMAPPLRPHLRAAAEKRAAARQAAREQAAGKRAAVKKAAVKKVGGKKLGAEKAGAKKAGAKKLAAKGVGARRAAPRR